MQDWTDGSEIHNTYYQRIQPSNNKFIDGILEVHLTWDDCKSSVISVGINYL